MWTVLPLKALSPVKTRLASILSPVQRDGLMKAMVEDVLTALRDCPAVEGILVVSRDPDIPALVDVYGAQVLVLEQDKDLNSAVQAATDYLAGKGIDRALVLHGDIPLANPADLARLIDESHHCELTLLPCNQGQGTNALVTSLPARIPFLYGEASYLRFKEAAEQAGLETLSLDLPEMALDIDTVEDLSALCTYFRENPDERLSHTGKFVAGLGFSHDSDRILDQAMNGGIAWRRSGPLAGADQ